MNGLEKYSKDEINLVLDVIKWKEEQEHKQLIRIKYTDDGYGEAAKEFGLPQRAYDDDAGLDLVTVLDSDSRGHGCMRIHPDERICLHTGIVAEFPIGYWGMIIHRSSSERRFRLRVVEGVIDDYRNELLIQVHNMNTWPIDIEHGQKIAQLILFKTVNFKCEIAEALRPSKRGSNGFGSSGFKAGV